MAPRTYPHSLLPLAVLSLAVLTPSARADAPRNATVEFNRDIRPILSNNCFVCHGPDKNLRKGKLRLDQARLTPSPEAERRPAPGQFSVALPGRPPTPQEVETFVADRAPKAYELAVERLLSAPHYGERMALYWLDVVRYADTAGYHSD